MHEHNSYPQRLPNPRAINSGRRHDLELTKAAAKAICADWLDPDETWEDQAEAALENALEAAIEEDGCDA